MLINSPHPSAAPVGYETRFASDKNFAELTNDVEIESAGNTTFPALDESDENEASGDADQNNSEARARAAEEALQQKQLEQDRRLVTELASRDREVRAHEQAHIAVGGRYAGAATYQYDRGPNGVNYAKSGEVPISTSKESTPQATIQKAEIVRRAALAPAEPSAQDRSVAARASAMGAEARKELIIERQRASKEREEARASDEAATKNKESQSEESTAPSREAEPAAPANPLPGSLGGRLFQSISNSTLSSREPGSLLSQIA